MQPKHDQNQACIGLDSQRDLVTATCSHNMNGKNQMVLHGSQVACQRAADCPLIDKDLIHWSHSPSTIVAESSPPAPSCPTRPQQLPNTCPTQTHSNSNRLKLLYFKIHLPPTSIPHLISSSHFIPSKVGKTRTINNCNGFIQHGRHPRSSRPERLVP